MTYDGKYAVSTSSASLTKVPNPYTFANVAEAQLTTSSSIYVSKHASYQVGDYVYILEGTNDARGFIIYKASKEDPTNITNTGSCIPVPGTGTAGEATLLVVGNYIYMFGFLRQSSGYDLSIWRAPISNPEAWYNTGFLLPSFVNLTKCLNIGGTLYIFGAGVAGDEIMTALASNPLSWSISPSVIATTGMFGQTLIETDTYIWIVGGADGLGTFYDAIQSALKSDPLTWTLSPSTFPIPVSNAKGYQNGTNMYLFHGATTGSVTIDDVYKATIDDPSTFVKIYDNGRSRSSFAMEVIDNNILFGAGDIVVYGGKWDAGTQIWKVTEYQIATEDGGPFTSHPVTFPAKQAAYYASYAIDDRILVVGGIDELAVVSDTAQQISKKYPTWGEFEVYAFDSTDNFNTVTILEPGIGGCLVRVKDTLYLLGHSQTQSGEVYAASVLQPTNFVSISATNGPVGNFGQAFVHNGFVYHMGGDNLSSTVYNTIKCASVDNMSDWKTLPLVLPANMARFRIAIVGNYLWLFGGTSTIAAGTPGTFVSTASRMSLNDLNKTSAAPWVSFTSVYVGGNLPWSPTMLMTATHIHIIGGVKGAGPVNEIQSTTLTDLAEGVCRPFISTNTFVADTAGANVHAVNGEYYIYGGTDDVDPFIGTNRVFRSRGNRFVRLLWDVKEGNEAVPAIDIGSGQMIGYPKFLQNGNYPWLSDDSNK